MDEHELLTRYTTKTSADAFASLVRENVDLVYAAARRQVGDAHLAEDVTQAVFLLLARKAGSVRGPLAGWLIKATYFTCRDAKKIADRRAFHERRAMEVRKEEVVSGRGEDSPWETVAPVLDESLLALRTKDRDALTFRYLKGLSLREVGEAQGISEEAARKRVDRATERLRDMMAAKTKMPGAAALGTMLGRKVLHVAPAGLAQNIVTASGALAKESLAHAIAQNGAKWMWWSQAKIAGAVLTVTAALAIAGTWAFVDARKSVTSSVPTATTSAASAPAAAGSMVPTADPDANESRVPGQIQVVRWDVLLDASELPALKKIATPLRSPSKIYDAYRIQGTDLRATVRKAIDAGTLIRGSNEMEIASAWNPDHITLSFLMPVYFQHMDDPSTPIMILGGSHLEQDTFKRTVDNHLHLKLDHPDFHVSIAELTRDTQWIQQPGQSLVYEGDLAPGEAAVFLGQLPPVNGRNFVHVVVWETFQADANEMALAPEERDVRWWCANGPSQLRRWADAARAWTAQAPEHSTTPAIAEMKLEDGKILRLEAICRPAKWPNCWWDAKGNPVRSQNKIIPFVGDPPEGLFAYVTVSGGAADERHRRNPSYNFPESGPYEEVECETIDDGTGSVELGVAVGPWKELARLEMNKPQAIEGVTYLIHRPAAFNDDQFLIHFSRTGVLKNDDLLLPTAADGKVAETRAEPTIVFEHPTEAQTKESEPNYDKLPLSKVVSYRLMQRKRAWVTFEHVAMEPRIAPQTSVTPAKAREAEQAATGRALDSAIGDLVAKRKIWAAMTPGRRSIFGTARMLIDAMHAGDEKTVRSLLTAKLPAAQNCLDAVAHFMVVSDATRRTLHDKLGRDLTNEELYRLGSSAFLFVDQEQELFGHSWSEGKDGIARMDNGGQYVMTRDLQGNYSLSVDELATVPSVETYLRHVTALAQRVNDDLRKRTTLTVAEFATLLNHDAAENAATPN